jgi:hypothetical protein
MGTFRDMFKKKQGEGKPLLHGEDVPSGKSSVTIVIAELREAPDNFGSIGIIDFVSPVYEKESWAVNKTNMRALLEKFNIPEEMEFPAASKRLKGKKLTLVKVKVNDPKKGKIVDSLFIS